VVAGDSSSSKNSPRARGLDLLRQVYDELYANLGDEFSAAELLQAAQTLIDVTNEEYGLSSYQDGQVHPGYYSFEVDKMLQAREWWILKTERSSDDSDDDIQHRDNENKARLRRYYTPDSFNP
jgi:hypothetical protein